MSKVICLYCGAKSSRNKWLQDGFLKMRTCEPGLPSRVQYKCRACRDMDREIYETTPAKCPSCLKVHTPRDGCRCSHCGCGLHPLFQIPKLVAGERVVICPRCESCESTPLLAEIDRLLAFEMIPEAKLLLAAARVAASGDPDRAIKMVRP